MITRYLSSAAVGIAVTTALLWTMQYLIDTGEGAYVHAPKLPELIILPTIDDTEPQVIEQKPDPIDPPVAPPPLLPPTEKSTESGGIRIPTQVTEPGSTKINHQWTAFSDGALVTIINARPEYPMRASSRNIEGHVIVEFDVTELGTVENVRVVETSNNVFDKAAIDAAYRSRYKPRVVNGVSQATSGLKKMYRFNMES